MSAETMHFSMETIPVRVAEVSEGEFISEFAKVMHEWGFKPFLRGEVRIPDRDHVQKHMADRVHRIPPQHH